MLISNYSWAERARLDKEEAEREVAKGLHYFHTLYVFLIVLFISNNVEETSWKGSSRR